MEGRKIQISDQKQLYFNGFPDCFAEVEADGYSLTLFPPYNRCGTVVEVSKATSI